MRLGRSFWSPSVRTLQEPCQLAHCIIEDRVVDEDAFRKVYKKNFDSFDASSLLVDMLNEYSPEVLFKEIQKALR